MWRKFTILYPIFPMYYRECMWHTVLCVSQGRSSWTLKKKRRGNWKAATLAGGLRHGKECMASLVSVLRGYKATLLIWEVADITNNPGGSLGDKTSNLSSEQRCFLTLKTDVRKAHTALHWWERSDEKQREVWEAILWAQINPRASFSDYLMCLLLNPEIDIYLIGAANNNPYVNLFLTIGLCQNRT